VSSVPKKELEKKRDRKKDKGEEKKK